METSFPLGVEVRCKPRSHFHDPDNALSFSRFSLLHRRRTKRRRRPDNGDWIFSSFPVAIFFNLQLRLNFDLPTIEFATSWGSIPCDLAMRWLPSISFSSSGGTSSSSSRSSPVRGGDAGERRSAEDNVRGGGWRFGSRVKITRQRKSRHLSDRNAPGMANLRSSSGYDKLPARSSSTSGIPQPLPLPEFLPGARWKERGATGSSASGDFDRPLPSPKAGPSRGIDDRERDRAENAPIRR